MPIEACECGHLSIDHVRVVYAAYVCSACSCTDHATVIPDDETADDINTILGLATQVASPQPAATAATNPNQEVHP